MEEEPENHTIRLLQEMRAEFRNEISALRGEFTEFRAEVRSEFTGFRNQIQELSIAVATLSTDLRSS